MDMIKSFLGTSSATCAHVPEALATPSGNACEECGSTFSLRMCATCGHVGCCESQARDAESHWKASGHEVMVAMPVGKSFTWCYEDKAYV